MAFFTKQTDTESVTEFVGGGDSKYISKSGMYPINVIVPFVSTGREKHTTIDLFVEYNEQKQVIYGGMTFTNKDGKPNVIGRKILNKLVTLAGVDDVDDPVEAELPIGKKGAMKDVPVLESLADVDVIMQIRMEYGVWNNSITEKTVIKSFFRVSDNASVEEIVAAEQGKDVEFGAQYAALAENADFVTYNDGLTEEQVAEWIKNKRPKNSVGSGSTSTTQTRKPSFGRKK